MSSPLSGAVLRSGPLPSSSFFCRDILINRCFLQVTSFQPGLFHAAAARGRACLINSGRQKDGAARGGRRACVDSGIQLTVKWTRAEGKVWALHERGSERPGGITWSQVRRFFHIYYWWMTTIEDVEENLCFVTSALCLRDVGAEHFS